MSLKRRTFLISAGTVLAIPATRLTLAGAHSSMPQEIKVEITRVGSQPSVKGSDDWFTGTVRIDPLF